MRNNHTDILKGGYCVLYFYEYFIQGWGNIPVYRTYRTEKILKISIFQYTVVFGTVMD